MTSSGSRIFIPNEEQWRGGLTAARGMRFFTLMVLVQDPRSTFEVFPRVSILLLAETVSNQESSTTSKSPEESELKPLELPEGLSANVAQLLELLRVGYSTRVCQELEQNPHPSGVLVGQFREEISRRRLPRCVNRPDDGPPRACSGRFILHPDFDVRATRMEQILACGAACSGGLPG